MAKKEHTNESIHFFASSVLEWRTTRPDRDLKQLMRQMDRLGHIYALYMVPVPYDAAYDIKNFAPQVNGAVWLGDYEPKQTKGSK